MYLPPEGNKPLTRRACLATAGFLSAVLFAILGLLNGWLIRSEISSKNANPFNVSLSKQNVTAHDETSPGGARDNLTIEDLNKASRSPFKETEANERLHAHLRPKLLQANTPKVATERASDSDFVYTITDLDSAPIPIIQGNPRYPRKFVEERVEGKVIAILSVDEEGNVFDVEVEAADYMEFAESARTAIFTWKFLPGRKDGKEVKFRMRVPVSYRLLTNRSALHANNGNPPSDYVRMPY